MGWSCWKVLKVPKTFYGDEVENLHFSELITKIRKLACVQHSIPWVMAKDVFILIWYTSSINLYSNWGRKREKKVVWVAGFSRELDSATMIWAFSFSKNFFQVGKYKMIKWFGLCISLSVSCCSSWRRDLQLFGSSGEVIGYILLSGFDISYWNRFSGRIFSRVSVCLQCKRIYLKWGERW